MTADEAARYETRDARRGPLIAIGAVLCVVIALAFLFSWTLMGYLAAHQPAGRTVSPLATTRGPMGPRLQIDPKLDLARKRAAADAVLHSYGWVDRGRGIVRIPIDRAIDILAEQER